MKGWQTARRMGGALWVIWLAGAGATVANDQGQYVIDCAELLESISDEDDWAFKENYFMD